MDPELDAYMAGRAGIPHIVMGSGESGDDVVARFLATGDWELHETLHIGGRRVRNLRKKESASAQHAEAQPPRPADATGSAAAAAEEDHSAAAA